MNELTAGSLFSGVGMFDLAFALAGYDVLFQVEIDPYCRKVIAKHAPTYWPNSTIYADVCTVGKHNLSRVDVLFGGFPCTDLSVAGKGAGIQIGTRSGLWFEFKRIIGEIRPSYVLLENVAAITRKDGHIVISDLAEMGYDCKWGVISAADAGALHLRERWFCVGYSNSGRLERISTITVTRQKNRVVNPKRPLSSRTERKGDVNQPRILRSADGASARVDGHRLMSHVFPVGPNLPQPGNEAPRMAPGNKNTNNRLKALGNGGLPQIVYPIACEIRTLLEGGVK